jgi:phosphopantothenoylcysteine decarboxylase/phosphopantothenate--cysteine ligase
MALVALGVSGGVGAYKAVEVVRGLQSRGHEVVAILTRSARRFVGPVTFEAITRRRVITTQWAPGTNADIEHISLASSADLLLVVPATAHVIAKFALGLADDFLSTMYLAARMPVLMAPAMNTNMLEHQTVKEHLRILAARGVSFVEPGEGYLACGWIGKGRLAEPEQIVEAAVALIRPRGTMIGRRVLVTAGPTYEDIDAVRFIGNRSSGRMGLAVAEEAARRGASVELVLGPTSLPPPANVDVIRVRSAQDMHDEVVARALEADAVVMAAAVADYAPAGGTVEEKITKSESPMTLRLERTPDILKTLGERRGSAQRPVLVGFAAETEDLIARARTKLASKRVDLIVANDVSRPDAGFDVSTNAATLVSRDGEEAFDVQPKRVLASHILDRIERFLSATSDVAAVP